MRPRWAQWTITVSILVAIASVVGCLGSTQVRCVGVDSSGEVVKARGKKCDQLDQVVIIELGPNGQIQYSGAEMVEFGP